MDGIPAIGNYAFDNCQNLESVVIPNSVTEIGEYTFRDNISLKELNLPDSIEKIGKYAFANCTSVQKLHIPNKLKEIPEYAFNGLTSCLELEIPSSVETISNWGFQGWNSLKNLNIPESVKFIGDKAFSRCNIQTLVIPDNVTSIGKQAFNYCKSLETVVWSKGATTIDAQTFYECNKLREITIPNTVTVIQSAAFSYTALQKLIIPSSVQVIGNSTFTNCQLIDVTFENPNNLITCGTPASKYWAFGNQNIGIALYCTSDGEYVDFATQGFKEAERIQVEGDDFENLGHGLWKVKSTMRSFPSKIKYSYNIIEDNPATVIGGEVDLIVKKTHKITFMCDGNILETKYYVEGEDFVFPNIPVRDGYTGIWNYDESDITGDKIIEVIYKALPVVEVDSIVIPQNDQLNWKDQFIFKDADGNKIDNVIFKGKVDTRKAGIYHLTYQVTDQWGGQMSGQCQVRVCSLPTLVGSDNVEIPIDTLFNPKGYFVFEDEDRNKINNVTFIGTLNSHQEGIYVLEYEVIDQWNQKLNGKCQVRVLRSPIINLDPDNNDSLNNDHVKDDLSDNNHKDN